MAYRHQPIGFLPEVSQLLGVSLELHAGCDAGQPVLDVLCRSLVHLHRSNTSIWFYRFFMLRRYTKCFTKAESSIELAFYNE